MMRKMAEEMMELPDLDPYNAVFDKNHLPELSGSLKLTGSDRDLEEEHNKYRS